MVTCSVDVVSDALFVVTVALVKSVYEEQVDNLGKPCPIAYRNLEIERMYCMASLKN